MNEPLPNEKGSAPASRSAFGLRCPSPHALRSRLRSATNPPIKSSATALGLLAWLANMEEELMSITDKNLDNWFSYHAPTQGQITSYQLLREAAHKFATTIVELTPPSADQTAAIRKVREAVMTANAAIACEVSCPILRPMDGGPEETVHLEDCSCQEGSSSAVHGRVRAALEAKHPGVPWWVWTLAWTSDGWDGALVAIQHYNEVKAEVDAACAKHPDVPAGVFLEAIKKDDHPDLDEVAKQHKEKG